MNWPRYVNPAGIGPGFPPPLAVIATASFFRIASLSCLLIPLGPMREKRNAGTAVSTAAARDRSRPPTLSLRSPSPMTK